MKNIFLLLFLFSSLNSFAQWQNLGQHTTHLQMVGNGIGYDSKNTKLFPGTPHSPYAYKIIATQNDWLTTDIREQFVGQTEGCCMARLIYFRSMSTGIRGFSDQGFNGYARTTDYAQNWTSFMGSNAILFFPMNVFMSSDSSAYFNTNYYINDTRVYRISNNQITQTAQWDTLKFNTALIYLHSSDGARCNIEFPNDSIGFIALSGDSNLNYVLRTSDFGANWNIILTDATNQFTSIEFPDETTGYASTVNGGLYKSTDGGLNWSSITSPTSSTINSIGFRNNLNGYLGCNNGEIYRTTNGGASWITENSGITSNILSIQVIDNHCAYAVAADSTLLKSETALGLELNETGIAVYPNPVTNVLNISASSDMTIEHVDIYDQYGKLVMISTETKIDISELAARIYTLTVYTEEGIVNSKFVKE